jgi:Raf kinase inhibitor-like YbhB/YbcL family protein
MAFAITCPSFELGAPIPRTFTCDGENRSPNLVWTLPPVGAASLALRVDDPDAPFGVFVHWLLYNLPPGLTGVAEGLPKLPQVNGVGTQGLNDFRRTGYSGPCPPYGTPHRYFFRLYALGLPPDLPSGMNGEEFERAIRGHVLAQTEWMGTYQRARA